MIAKLFHGFDVIFQKRNIPKILMLMMYLLLHISCFVTTNLIPSLKTKPKRKNIFNLTSLTWLIMTLSCFWEGGDCRDVCFCKTTINK